MRQEPDFGGEACLEMAMRWHGHDVDQEEACFDRDAGEVWAIWLFKDDWIRDEGHPPAEDVIKFWVDVNQADDVRTLVVDPADDRARP